MSHVPITRIGQVLIVSIQEDLDDDAVEDLERRVAAHVVGRTTTGLLLDVSGLEIVDSFVARVIGRMVSIVRLLGCHAVVTGIRPAVAITLVELGLYLADVTTALDAERGLRILQAQAEVLAESATSDLALEGGDPANDENPLASVALSGGAS